MVFTRKQGGFHGRTVSFREGKMVNAHLGCGFHSSPQATNHLCQGLNSTPLYWGCDKLIPPLINRESLFHGYIKHPYGLGLMSGNPLLY